MTALFLALTAAYLLGSISGSLLLGRFRGVDIRTQGSGNAGGSNALRTQGALFALGVMFIDVGKGYLAAGLIPSLLTDAPISGPWIVTGCALAAMIGHVKPAFYGFRGGKGAATFLGAAAAILPSALMFPMGIWLLLVVLTGYVGLATMGASVSFAAACLWLTPEPREAATLAFGACGAVLILLTHQTNIQRLRQGTENRFEKVRVVNWFR